MMGKGERQEGSQQNIIGKQKSEKYQILQPHNFGNEISCFFKSFTGEQTRKGMAEQHIQGSENQTSKTHD